MKREKIVSFTLTDEEYEALYIKVAKRTIKDKKHITISSYVGDLIREHLNGQNNVSPPEVDTDSKQKNNEWHEFTLDGIDDE